MPRSKRSRLHAPCAYLREGAIPFTAPKRNYERWLFHAPVFLVQKLWAAGYAHRAESVESPLSYMLA